MTRRAICLSSSIIAEVGDEVKPGLSSCSGALLRIAALSLLPDYALRITGRALDKHSEVLYTCN